VYKWIFFQLLHVFVIFSRICLLILNNLQWNEINIYVNSCRKAWLLNNQKNLLDCPRHTTLRQQLFFSLLDIPETISLNLLIFGSVNLNDEENKAVFKSVQTFIIKSKRFTPWHAYIIFFHLFNLIQSLCIIIFK
jgi:hypothetical protein